MSVMVTGATGFIGRHVVTQLLAHGYSVVAVARDHKRARKMTWYNQVEFIRCDLHNGFQELFHSRDSIPSVIVHLAWSGLPNYHDYSHISTNFPADLRFLEAAVHEGVTQIIVAGTCLEYGMQFGPLTEDMETKPSTSYGLAKDMLRKSLQMLQRERHFTFQWLRLFYLYGEGQSKSSLFGQLDRTIEEGQTTFNMSPGDQLRDYIPVEEVAKTIVVLLKVPECDGVINCCSGNPISVLDIVQQHCRDKLSDIKLNRGYYPYPDYEPLAFWGDSTKLIEITDKFRSNKTK